MKRELTAVCIIASGILAALTIQGCGNTSAQFDEAAIRRIAREEAKKEHEEMLKSFAPEKFGFGGALEKEWGHA